MSQRMTCAEPDRILGLRQVQCNLLRKDDERGKVNFLFAPYLGSVHLV